MSLPALDILTATRRWVLSLIEDLPEATLRDVPQGHRNNLLWNIGHVAYVEAVFLYEDHGLENPLPKEYAVWFSRGSSPADWPADLPVADVLARSRALHEQVLQDFAADRFQDFKGRTVMSLNLPLATTEAAVAFLAMHEGVHLGFMLSLRKHIR